MVIFFLKCSPGGKGSSPEYILNFAFVTKFGQNVLPKAGRCHKSKLSCLRFRHVRASTLESIMPLIIVSNSNARPRCKHIYVRVKQRNQLIHETIFTTFQKIKMHPLFHPGLTITTTKCQPAIMTNERQVWISKLAKILLEFPERAYLYRSCRARDLNFSTITLFSTKTYLPLSEKMFMPTKFP